MRWFVIVHSIVLKAKIIELILFEKATFSNRNRKSYFTFKGKEKKKI
jgi:hypothetical protein